MAVASSGGHWVQLLRLREAFADQTVVYVTVAEPSMDELDASRVYIVNDANQHRKISTLLLAFKMLRILWRERPDVIVSTGAAPGCLAICIGKLLGAKTVWIDSLANVERLSLSGRIVKRFADLWLTQWEHLARPDGPGFKGAVL